MIKKGLFNRVEQLERKLLETDPTYHEELLTPKETDKGWLIEGIEFSTQKEALEFADRLRKNDVEAFLEELAKDVSWE